MMTKEEANKKLMDDIDKILERAGRPTILPQPMPVYEYDTSRIPEKIRVSFSDGTTAVYELRMNQPAPVIMENIRIIRKWKQGYVNKPARRKKK